MAETASETKQSALQEAGQTKRAAGDGIEEIAALLPPGSAVALLGATQEGAGEYMRRLRRKGIGSYFCAAEACERTLCATVWDADVRGIVALGGEKEADCAKRLGYLRRLPVYAVLDTPSALTVADARCALWSDGAVRLFPGAAPALVAFLSPLRADELPAALGGICCAALGALDRTAYGYAIGTPPDPVLCEQVLTLVYRGLDAANTMRRDDPAVIEALAETAVSLSLLAQEKKAPTVVRGAADDCARAYATLLHHEERPLLRRGVCAFLFGAVLARMYGVLGALPGGFVPPPDNNLRADRLTEYFGLSPVVAAAAAVSRLPRPSLAAYRVHEYRDELGALAADVARVFDEARRPFRRLFPDDGYGLRGTPDLADARAVIALAPDLFPADGSGLTVLRELGYLERYL